MSDLDKKKELFGHLLDLKRLSIAEHDKKMATLTILIDQTEREIDIEEME